MAQAEIERVLKVNKDKLFGVITRYEDYPQFVDNVNRVTVDRKEEGKVLAHYDLSVMGKEFEYTIELHEDQSSGNVRWNLIESDLFKKNTGEWILSPEGEAQTKVKYSLELEFKIPVPGFILKKLVKGNLPQMIESFEKRAR